MKVGLAGHERVEAVCKWAAYLVAEWPVVHHWAPYTLYNQFPQMLALCKQDITGNKTGNNKTKKVILVQIY